VSSAVLDPPRTAELETDWVVLEDYARRDAREADFIGRVRMRGYGVDRHGLIPASGITAAPRNLVALPSADDLLDA
jgi:hypothetical protein